MYMLNQGFLDRFSNLTNRHLRIGPVGLTTGTNDPPCDSRVNAGYIGTLSLDTSATIPTVTDNLFSQGSIANKSVAISASSNPTSNGELTRGDIDSSKFTGSINYAPITSSFPANKYWGVDQSIYYGNILIQPCMAGIVDTGTTLVLVGTAAFVLYETLTGARMDSELSITSAQYQNSKSLNLKINGQTYGLTPNAQIWPRSLNTAIGGSADKICGRHWD